MTRINHEILAAQQYATVFNWKLTLPAHPNLKGEDAALFGENGILNINCESTELPKSPIKHAEAMVRGVRTTQAVTTNPDGSITFVWLEKDTYAISKFFDKVKGKTVNRQTKHQGNKSEYMWPNGIILDLMDGKGAVQDSYELQYGYVEDYNLAGLEGDGEFQKVTLTLGYLNYKHGDQ